MIRDVLSWFVMFRGGSSWFVMVRDVSWWFVVVRSGSWWFNCGGFVVVQKSPEKGHVTLYLTNHRTKFTTKSHF